jgi:hypothetical protein
MVDRPRRQRQERQASEPEVDTAKTPAGHLDGEPARRPPPRRLEPPCGASLPDQLHRSAGGAQLGIQLGDAAPGRRQLGLLGDGQAREGRAVERFWRRQVEIDWSLRPGALPTSVIGRPRPDPEPYATLLPIRVAQESHSPDLQHRDTS